MSTHDGEQSYCVDGKDPWERTRHFHDGRDPVSEWQCADCHKWYPMFKGVMGWSQSIEKGVWSQPFCYACRPPRTGLLKHLHDGGACIIGFTNSNNPWKRWADRQQETNGKQEKSED